MNIVAINSNKIKRKVMNDLKGYWALDEWKIEEFPLPDRRGKIKETKKIVDFNKISNEYIKLEIKYYSFYSLTNEIWLLSSFMEKHFYKMYFLSKFLVEKFPQVTSIIDIPYTTLLDEYKLYLTENNKPLKYPHHRGGEFISPYLGVCKSLYDFFSNYYDERPEHQKDKWNIKRLGIPYNMSRRDRFLNFTSIKFPFRELVKKYVNQTLLIHQQITFATAQNILKKMYLFFDFIVETYPKWIDLQNLQRQDIEDFLFYVRNREMGGKSYTKNRVPSNRHIIECLSNVRRIIEYMQGFEWKEAPKTPVNRLIFPEDFPRREKKNYHEHVKHVPDFIWEQVLENLHDLDSEIARLIVIMEATGFRVSDVCQLQLNCLTYKQDGWWLVGDQRKVNVKEHIVPISEEIVEIVKIQQEYINNHEKNHNNLNQFLFPVLTGKNRGMAFSQKSVTYALNQLAEKYKILDKNGEIFLFKNHAFRHRYGVNLINNGMNILHVQKLMAHTSPEMTLTYAKISDNTLRREWEKVQNSVRIDTTGELIQASLPEQAEENGLELEWIRHNMDSIRLDHGLCIKSPKVSCEFLDYSLETPCIKNNCRSFHVDTTFLDYYNAQILKMEEDIIKYQTSGRIRSIELIQPKLNKYKEIRDSLKNEIGIFGMPKHKREYIGEERKIDG
ncbi:tyrosine-type recombinase/integrase [Bacillus cereus]|nr:tyrosine-type recombinase/integrase [Bacillus cereus]